MYDLDGLRCLAFGSCFTEDSKCLPINALPIDRTTQGGIVRKRFVHSTIADCDDSDNYDELLPFPSLHAVINLLYVIDSVCGSMLLFSILSM